MMERDYVIIRQPDRLETAREPTRDASLSGLRSAGGSVFEFARMTQRERSDRARDPQVAAMAPDLPLKLLDPVSLEANTRVESSGEVWGLRAVGAHNTSYTGRGVKVAVLDTGIDRDHEAFRGVELTEVDYTGDGNGDPDGHGTHCAGTIFGRDVGGVRIGVAPGVTQAFIGKVIGRRGGGTGALLRAIHEASEAGCQIISMSLGFDFPGAIRRLQQDFGYPEDLAAAMALSDYRANIRLFDCAGRLMEAQNRARRDDVLLFAASGNESKRHIDPEYEMPAAAPSEAEGFTSVGALEQRSDGTLAVATFSNIGCTVCAPGVGILSARAGSVRDLVALSGTSMATPHVAGVAALFAEKEAAQPLRRGLFQEPGVLRGRVVASASETGIAAGFTRGQVGYGLVRAPQP